MLDLVCCHRVGRKKDFPVNIRKAFAREACGKLALEKFWIASGKLREALEDGAMDGLVPGITLQFLQGAIARRSFKRSLTQGGENPALDLNS